MEYITAGKRFWKRLGIVAAALCVWGCSQISVKAQETQPSGTQAGERAVALGEDLTAPQREEILRLFGLTEETLSEYPVVTVTNEMEHEALGSYLPSSLIGSKSLSSVMLKKAEKGAGVTVTVQNITYCTQGMYQSALVTAGLEDVEVVVAAPLPISGTAALIGAVKAYEALAGVMIPAEALDTAIAELIATGQLAQEAAGGSDNQNQAAEQLYAFVKEKLANGELETEEDIRGAIAEGEAKFGINLTEEQKRRIVEVMWKINKLGLDPDRLLEQAKNLYDEWGEQILDSAQTAIDEKIVEPVKEAMIESFKQAAADFFKELGESIKDFFTGLFGKKSK